MSRTRIHNLSISLDGFATGEPQSAEAPSGDARRPPPLPPNLPLPLDGFATGEPQSAEAPFGHAGERLHEWMFGTRFWDAGGSAGVDDAFAGRHGHGIGAEAMGANKVGP